MLMVLSPAKTLELNPPLPRMKATQPRFLRQSAQAVRALRKLNTDELGTTLRVSAKLAQLNAERYQNWKTPFTPENARPAVLMFKGDVYLGLKAEEFSTENLRFAQKHLRILSGLYGVLRPMDLMQAYRLEMGSAFGPGKHENLYSWWGTKVTDALNDDLPRKRNAVLLNLASSEYFRVIQQDRLKARVISPVFKDYSRGQYKVMSLFAKQSRGRMASWIIRNRITDAAQLPEYNLAGYWYNEEESTAEKPVYYRDGH